MTQLTLRFRAYFCLRILLRTLDLRIGFNARCNYAALRRALQ